MMNRLKNWHSRLIRAVLFFALFSSSISFAGQDLGGYFMTIPGFANLVGAIIRLNYAMKIASQNPMDQWRRDNVRQAMSAMPAAIMGLAAEFQAGKLHDPDLAVVQGMLGGFVDVSAASQFSKFLQNPDPGLIPQVGNNFPGDLNSTSVHYGGSSASTLQYDEGAGKGGSAVGGKENKELADLGQVSKAISSVSQSEKTESKAFTDRKPSSISEPVSAGEGLEVSGSSVAETQPVSSNEIESNSSDWKPDLSSVVTGSSTADELARDLDFIQSQSDSQGDENLSEEEKESENKIFEFDSDKEKKSVERKKLTRKEKLSSLEVKPKYWRALSHLNLMKSLWLRPAMATQVNNPNLPITPSRKTVEADQIARILSKHSKENQAQILALTMEALRQGKTPSQIERELNSNGLNGNGGPGGPGGLGGPGGGGGGGSAVGPALVTMVAAISAAVAQVGVAKASANLGVNLASIKAGAETTIAALQAQAAVAESNNQLKGLKVTTKGTVDVTKITAEGDTTRALIEATSQLEELAFRHWTKMGEIASEARKRRMEYLRNLDNLERETAIAATANSQGNPVRVNSASGLSVTRIGTPAPNLLSVDSSNQTAVVRGSRPGAFQRSPARALSNEVAEVGARPRAHSVGERSIREAGPQLHHHHRRRAVR